MMTYPTKFLTRNQYLDQKSAFSNPSYAEISSPFGPLFVGFFDNGKTLAWLSFMTDKQTLGDHIQRFSAHIKRPEQALTKLEGISSFKELKTTINSIVLIGTEFQLSVWEALQGVPSGQTWTYGQIAKEIGKPKAARAVGQALNKNPVAILFPCHRVIGTTFRDGFASGGKIKEQLLKSEAA